LECLPLYVAIVCCTHARILYGVINGTFYIVVLPTFDCPSVTPPHFCSVVDILYSLFFIWR